MNAYRKLSNADKSITRETEYANLLKRITIARGTFKGIPEDVPPDFINKTFLEHPFIAVFKTNGNKVVAPDFDTELTIAFAVPNTDINRYGTTKTYTATCYNGETFSVVPGVNCVIGYNNSINTPDKETIDRYAYLLSETDVSLECNLLNSRQSKMFRADDDKTKNALIKAYKELRAGEPMIAVVGGTSGNDFADALNPFDSVDITDVRNVDKLQFLCRFHDYLQTEYLLNHGFDATMINKSAQVGNGEIDNASRKGQVLAEEHIKYRKKLCDDVNKMFGVSWSYEPGNGIKETAITEETEIVDDVKGDDDNGTINVDDE